MIDSAANMLRSGIVEIQSHVERLQVCSEPLTWVSIAKMLTAIKLRWVTNFMWILHYRIEAAFCAHTLVPAPIVYFPRRMHSGLL